MKSGFLKPHQKRPNRRKVVVFYSTVLLVSAWLLVAFLQGGTGDFATQVMSPFRAIAGGSIRITRRIGGFFTLSGTFMRNIAALEDENRLLREKIVAREISHADAIAADAGVQATDNSSGRRIIAHVIGKGAEKFGQEMLLDRGTIAGVREGDAVIFGERTLVGRVFSVTPLYAHVHLLGNREFRVGAKISEEAGLAEIHPQPVSLRTGLVRGEGLGTVSFDMIEPGALVNEGDTIATSGFDGLFPPGLLIGKLSRVTSGPSDFFQKASLRPSADLGEIEAVTILKTHQSF